MIDNNNDGSKVLLLGHPGCGKTSLSKIKDTVFDCDQSFYHTCKKGIDQVLTAADVLGKSIIMNPFYYGSLKSLDNADFQLPKHIELLLVYPEATEEAFKEYAKRINTRVQNMSSQALPGDIERSFWKNVETAEKFSRFDHTKIILKPEEYLVNGLDRCGIKY